MERIHHRLRVWQAAIELVKAVYTATGRFPRTEVYGLAAQMRRAAVSVASNIAEGAARSSLRERLQFLAIARGSLSELETQLVISRELGYLGEDLSLDERLERVFSLLGGLMEHVRRGLPKE
jgi:four helix bundle protein